MKNDMKRPMSNVSPDNLEIDKISGAWVLTHWVGSGGVALRLKIDHKYENDAYFEEHSVTAEIRFGRYFTFLPIHSFSISIGSIILSNCDCGVCCCDPWSCLPTMFAEDFKAMLQAFGRIAEIASFGCTDRLRYGADASDSRDLYELAPEDPPVAG